LASMCLDAPLFDMLPFVWHPLASSPVRGSPARTFHFEPETQNAPEPLTYGRAQQVSFGPQA